MLTSSNITEGRSAPRPGASTMTEFKAGPIRRKPTHPGAIIRSDLEALNKSVNEVALAIGVTRAALGNVVLQKSAVTPIMALRLSRYFRNTTPEFWLALQNAHDIWVEKKKFARELAGIKAGWNPPKEIPVED